MAGMMLPLVSLSARRAWIEIWMSWLSHFWDFVALRKESVDRNGLEVDGVSYDVWSLSARRAWIEMSGCFFLLFGVFVALRKESVDRNYGYF